MAAPRKGNSSKDGFEEAFETIERFLNKPVLNTYCRVYDILPRPELIAHPFQYMSTLVQIGYEPLPPKLSRSLFGRTQLQLPGFFTYMKFIAKTDGFWGIYRGLKFNIMYMVVNRFGCINVNHYLKEHYYPELKNEDAKYENARNLTRSIVCESVTRVGALVIAYPFHLMMVRSMAQFIGRETYYDTLSGAIADIYSTGDGFSGFYAGFIPFALGECALIVLESTLMFIFFDKFEQMGFQKPQHSFLATTVNIVARAIVYPFKLVSTVMSCNGYQARSLAASAYTAPEYANWIECWRTLWIRGEIKRGSSLWWRYMPITSPHMFPMQPITRAVIPP